jgi:glucose 1-dehydrogenase
MPRRPLEGQFALVTGGNSGIGEGVALALGAAGAAVVVNYVEDPEAAARVVDTIRTGGSDAMAILADVTDEGAVQSMFRQALAAWPTIDILVNNAGIQEDAALSQMTLAQWRSVLDVNLTGMFLCTREAVREMLRRGPRPQVSRATGKVICISSVHDRIPWATHGNYAASKGGVKLFMESVAQELGPHRIRVNSIAPGAIQTAINRAAWETPEARDKLLALIPYGRIGVPADIGRAAVWLASDEADYVHGHTLYVDGGMTLYPAFARGG